jgi:hypothetical protein
VIGSATGTGVGTGASITIIGSGICLVIVALIMSGLKQIGALEKSAAAATASSQNAATAAE